MPIVRGTTLRKQAELSIPEKKTFQKYQKKAAKGSRIVNHAWSHNQAIDFENASVVDKGGFGTRKTLEAWRAKLTFNADNNSLSIAWTVRCSF